MVKKRHFWANWRCPHCRRSVRIFECFSKRRMYTIFCPSCRLRIFYFDAKAVGIQGLSFQRREYS